MLQTGPAMIFYRCSKLCSLPVRLDRHLKPAIVFDIGQQLGRNIAHLAQQMPRPFAYPFGSFQPLRLSENKQRFSGHAAVFTGAEREHIDAGFAADFGWMTAKTGNRIAKAGAVHVGFHAQSMGDITQGSDFIN